MAQYRRGWLLTLKCWPFSTSALDGAANPGEIMQPISFKRRRFPADVIRPAVWRYLRFTLSTRDVRNCVLNRAWEAATAAA